MNWISVSESLPETGKKVIATFVNQSGKRRTICAHHIDRWTVESDSDSDCYDEYSEEKDAYFFCEGWYENIENWGEYSAVHVCEGEITHWMPLPESPEQQALQPVVPAQWRVVMRGMVEYAECNDPGNPYLDQAKTLLSAGKETV